MSHQYKYRFFYDKKSLVYLSQLTSLVFLVTQKNSRHLYHSEYSLGFF